LSDTFSEIYKFPILISHTLISISSVPLDQLGSKALKNRYP